MIIYIQTVWELCKLKVVSERIRGNDGRMDLPTLTISAGNGWLDQRERFSGNIAGKEQKKYTLLSKGEISYNHGNSKLAKYGAVFVLRTFEEALVPRVYHSFKTNDKASGDFIEYMFATKIPDKELAKLVSSGARMDGLLNINYDDFMGIKITIPSLQEQEQISSLLRHLDISITLHQRKLEAMKQLKHAYQQQLIPEQDRTTPDLRFANFNQDWEQRKLGEEATIVAGGDIDRTKLLESGKYQVLANALTNDGIVGYYEDDYRIQAPALTVTGRGNVGYAKARRTSFTPVVRLLAVTSCHDIDFLEAAINNHKTIIESTGVPQLTSPQLAKYKISFPSLEEEKRIGELFKSIDVSITLHQHKLESLNKLKQAYLQKMFI